MISLVRVDDRLVHAQVVVGWIEYLRCLHVVVVDDAVADDPDRVELFRMVVPQEVELDAMSTGTLAAQWDEMAVSADPVLLLFANPLSLESSVNLGIRPREVNLGGMHVAPGRHSWIHGLYASDTEIASIRKMTGMGIAFEIRTIPTAKPRELDGEV